jgi:outer membrane lipoprotein SlyB
MKRILNAVVCAALLSLTACAENQGQNVFNAGEVGKQAEIEFGVIKAVKHVKVQKEQTTGVGAVGGATAGGVAGAQIGNGNGQVAGAIAGVLLGAIAGEMAERKLSDQVGIMYIIRKENKKTVSIVQNINKDDEPLHVGQRVMIQTSGEYQKASGSFKGAQFQRVLPAED